MAAPSAKRLPGMLAALKKPKGSDDRAKALTTEIEDWFEAWLWIRKERIELSAHYNGLHWGYLDDRRLLWVGNTLDEDADRVRITVPVTKRCVDQAAAMMTQDDPVFRAAQGRPGVAAAAAGECARAFLDKVWEQHRLADLYQDTAKSSFYLGTDFILLEHDETAGPLGPILRPDGTPVMEAIPDDEASEGADDEAGEGEAPVMPEGVGADGSLVAPSGPAGGVAPQDGSDAGAPAPALLPPTAVAPPVRPKFGPQGDLKYRVVPGEDVAFDPLSKKRGGQDGIGVVIRWQESRARLMEIAPDKFEELPESGQPEARSTVTESRIARSSASGSPYGDEKQDDALTVYCLFLRARPDAQRGNAFLICEGKILWEGDNDIYPTEEEVKNGELWPAENWPLFDFIADSRPGCPWGRARTLDVIGLQHAINAEASKCLQDDALMANRKYVMPAGMDDEPTDEPGQVFRVARQFWAMTNGDPVRIINNGLGPDYLSHMAVLIAQFEQAVGINAASQGQAPSNDPSGRLSDSLQKRDDARIAPLRRAHNRQWARLQNYALRLIRRHWTGERMLKMTGADGSVALQSFKVADLAAGTEVLVMQDTLPSDMQQRQLLLTNVTKDLAALGDNEELKTAYLEALGMPDMTDFLRRRSPHLSSAIDNNRLLLLGQRPLPAPWDNPLIHKAELERFLCSRDYKDRVTAEKADPAAMGQSMLESNAVWLWTYWAQHAIPAAPPAPSSAIPGPGNVAGPQSAPPQAVAA